MALVIRALYKPSEFEQAELGKMIEIIEATPLVEFIILKTKTEVSQNVKELLEERDTRIDELAKELHTVRNGSNVVPTSSGQSSPEGASPSYPPAASPPPPNYAEIQAMVVEAVRQLMPAQAAPVAPTTASGYRPANRANPIAPWLNNR